MGRFLHMSAEQLQIFVFDFYIEKNPLLVHFVATIALGVTNSSNKGVHCASIQSNNRVVFVFRNTPFTHRGWLNGPRCEWDSDFSAEMQRRGKLEIYCNSFHQSEYAKSCIQPKPPHKKTLNMKD